MEENLKYASTQPKKQHIQSNGDIWDKTTQGNGVDKTMMNEKFSNGHANGGIANGHASGHTQPHQKNHGFYKTGCISMGMVFIMYYLAHIILVPSMPLDVRQHDWVMMRSSVPILVISVVYVLFVTWLGPLFMNKREPFKWLRHAMLVFNILQIILNLYLAYLGIRGGWNGSYSIICQLCDFSNNPEAIFMLHASYWYVISKLTDLFDTVFFVLNKKCDHISIIHVVHHSIMPINVYFCIKYYPGGHSAFIGFLDVPIHIVRYFYMVISVMGPQYRKYMWWKKYLTRLQITMFVLIIAHSVQMAFNGCPVPSPLVIWIGGIDAMFLIIFLDYYRRMYLKRKKN